MAFKHLAVAAALSGIALAAGAPAQAAERVALAHSVFVERAIPAADGTRSRVLEPARVLRRGDRLVYVVAWRKDVASAEQFTVVNPLPRTVSYQRSANGLEEVSIDGGRSWGQLGTLRVRDEGGWRNASAEDVTHVRWRVPRQMALTGSGRLTFSGIVR